jgi:hypothetical protein
MTDPHQEGGLLATKKVLGQGGTLDVSQAAGLGLAVDHDKLARYRAKFEEEGMASIYPTSTEGPVISVPAY